MTIILCYEKNKTNYVYVYVYMFTAFKLTEKKYTEENSLVWDVEQNFN